VGQSEFNRRRRALYPALAALQRALAERLGADSERERILDTKPVPVMLLKRHDARGLLFDGQAAVGWCQAKRQYCYGFKLVLALTLDGVSVGDDRVPADVDDREAAAALLAPGCRCWADKGFHGRAAREGWAAAGAAVWAAPPRTGRDAWPRPFARLARRLRQRIEVVNAQLTGQFARERAGAKTLWGLVTRVQAKLTAHTVGVYLNVLRGEPPLALKALLT
jgi:hypothetical protein